MILLSHLLHDIETLFRTSTIVKKEPINTARETQLILSSLLGIGIEEQLRYPEQAIQSKQAQIAVRAVKKRASGQPLAYVLGYQYFYTHKFTVTDKVLIPRIETEKMVELCLSFTKQIGEETVKNTKKNTNKNTIELIPHHILDCGTGSGCIGISLADALHDSTWSIALSDIDEDALAVARLNAKKILGESVKKLSIYKDTLLTKVLANTSMKNKRPGIILANLPYVCEHELAFSNISKEPLHALSDKSFSGIASISKLIAQSSTLCYPHILILECDPLQIDGILRAVAYSSYQHIQSFYDCFKRIRFITCINFKI